MDVSIWSGLISGVITAVTAAAFAVNDRRKTHQEFEQQEALQKKLSKQKIDADLKSSERIKWINQVRSETVELLKSYRQLKMEDALYHYKIDKKIDFSDQRPYLTAMNNVKLKTDTLILLFGANNDTNQSLHFDFSAETNVPIFEIADSDHENETQEALKKSRLEDSENQLVFKVLKDKYSNENKNSLIVELLSQTESLLIKASYPDTSNPQVHNYKSRIKLAEYSGIWEVIDKNLREISRIIGLYLKIEWDRAKKGN